MLELTPKELIRCIDKPLFRKISEVADEMGVE